MMKKCWWILLATLTECCTAFLARVNHNLNAPDESIRKTRSMLGSLNLFGFGETTKEISSVAVAEDQLSEKSKVLIEKARNFAYNQSGFYSEVDEDVLSGEFVFRGPVIGPYNKKDYCKVMKTFKIYEVVEDINPNAWGFSIDPKNPNRVWFLVRNSGTISGKPFLPDTLNFKPEKGGEVNGCPETFSIIFDDDEKVKYLSVGYVADRFEGNTYGKGAALGILKIIGLPAPDPGPLFRFFGWLNTEVIKVLPSYSKELPEWWNDDRVLNDGY